ncbi:MAG TPA: hypothetical protein VF176_02545 [Solirubrobacterales bacterium]
MAQTRKKRSRKRRGTQGGRIDTNRRAARPRSREEAKARARAGRKSAPRVDAPPTWRNAATRGLVAAVIFFALLLLLFRRPLGAALALGAFMLVFYIPAGYYIDTAMWRRRERARLRSRGK